MRGLPNLSPSRIVLIVFAVALFSGAGFLVFYSNKLRFFSKPELQEAPKAGSCLVLEEEFCLQGKLVYEDEKLVFVGFRVPKGTVLFSPFDGIVSNTSRFSFNKSDPKVSYPGNSVGSKEKMFVSGMELPEKQFSAVYYEDVQTEKVPNQLIEMGGIVGYVSDKAIEAHPEYNLMVFWVKGDQDRGTYLIDEEKLKALFSL